MKKYEYDVDVTITYVKTVSVEAVDDEQAEYFAHRDMRKEFGLDCDIEIRSTMATGVVQDDRRRKERWD
jgi:hypothetical protein